jgi:hypothetical protein
MKNNFFVIFIIIFILAQCSSSEKLLRKGNYDALINKAVKNLIKNPSSEEDAIMLDKAYNLANQRDIERINYLRIENNPQSYEEIYRLYSILNNRQNTVRKVLPIKIGGRTIQYDYVDYNSLMAEAKANAADYFYQNAKRLMNNNTKESYRQAYNEFIKAKNYRGSVYPDIDNLINEARYLGISRVLLGVVNNTIYKLPDEFLENLITIDTRELNSNWVEYHVRKIDRNTQYDYYVDVVLKMIEISPDIVNQKDRIEKKTIDDGFSYVLDSRGNVMKDSLGNDIKVKKYKDISCTIIETHKEKHCTIKGDIEIVSVNPNQLLKKIPVAASSHFDNISARAVGDLNAVNPETKRLLQIKPLPFPDDFSLINDCAETLRMAIHDALINNRSIIR